MKLLVEPIINNRKEIVDTISSYNPSKMVTDRFKDILRDFELAERIQEATYEEFGNKDLISYQNQAQKRFNNNIDVATDDPNQAWRANTIRPLTRNKVISIVAHLTQNVLYPTVIAQNDDSEEDKDMAQVMMDAMEWAGEQSKYDDLFLAAVLDMCVNPAVILYEGFADVKRKIKEIQDNGTWTEKEIKDELYSGFLNQIVPCDELFIGNVYEPDIQKQPFLIRRKVIDFTAAHRKYGHLEEFKYVQPGLRTFFNSDDELYYDQYDEELTERLVEEVVYYNRSADLELRIINGVMIDDPDRPIQRKDKMYPFAKSFYEMFNSRFFYGMPLVAKLKPDQDVIDTLYNMVIDGTFMQYMPPTAVYGVENIDSSVMIPGATTAFKDPNSRIEPISTGGNLNGALNILQKVENSASESSQDPLQSGQYAGGDRTKYEVVRLEQNARTVLGMTGKMIAQLVRDFGRLRINTILQYLPIAELSEVMGDDVKIKFPTIVLPNKNIEGRTKTRRIEFTTDMPETEEDQEKLEYDLLRRSGMDVSGDEIDYGQLSICIVNPDAFRKMKYLTKVEPDFNDRATKFFKKIQLYDRAIGNPLANQEAIFRDFLLEPFVPGQSDKYIRTENQASQSPIMQEVIKAAQQNPARMEMPQQEQI